MPSVPRHYLPLFLSTAHCKGRNLLLNICSILWHIQNLIDICSILEIVDKQMLTAWKWKESWKERKRVGMEWKSSFNLFTKTDGHLEGFTNSWWWWAQGTEQMLGVFKFPKCINSFCWYPVSLKVIIFATGTFNIFRISVKYILI